MSADTASTPAVLDPRPDLGDGALYGRLLAVAHALVVVVEGTPTPEEAA